MLPKTRTQPPPAKPSTENLSSGDFIAAEIAPSLRSTRSTIPRAPRVPHFGGGSGGSRGARSFAPQTLKTPEPWLSTTQNAASQRPSTRPLASRPIYQNQPARPVTVPSSAPPPMSEAALADFFAQFERTSALPQAPVSPPAWRSAPIAPSYVSTPAPQSLAPVAMTTSADDSSRMNVQRGDTKNGLVTSRTFVIETKKGGGSWAAFMVAFGALVGVLASMAVVKYKADQQQRFAAATVAQEDVPAMQVAAPPQPQVAIAQPQMGSPQVQVQTQVAPTAPFANTPAVTASPSAPTMQSAFSTGIAAPQLKTEPTKSEPKTESVKPVVATKVEPKKVAAPAKVAVRASAPAARPVKVATKTTDAPAKEAATEKQAAPAKTDSAQRMLEAAQRETGNSLN